MRAWISILSNVKEEHLHLKGGITTTTRAALMTTPQLGLVVLHTYINKLSPTPNYKPIISTSKHMIFRYEIKGF